jgi:hypothetical protein
MMKSRPEPQQVDLLIQLVEAYRSLPSSRRGRFLVRTDFNAFNVWVWNEGHEGGGHDIAALPADLEILAGEGLIRYCDRDMFIVPPAGMRFYEQAKLGQGQPVQRVENSVRAYLNAERFRSANPGAYEKWQSAEANLWGDDSDRNLTTIGHLIREAMQEFADGLVRALSLEGAHPEKSKTIKRIESVLERVGSKTDRALLASLVGYWRAVNDVAQRQEHGNAADPLTWEHARIAVFHTLFVMCEIDRLVRGS